MGKNFKACFFSSAKLSKCLRLEESFIAALEAIEPKEDIELLLFVLSDSNLLELNVGMRFSRIASNLAGRAMDLLAKEGCPHGEVHAKVQSLFRDMCSGWITEESFKPKKQEFVNLIATWLVKEKGIDGHSLYRPGPNYQHPLGMLAKAMDLCFSPGIFGQIKGVKKYLEAVNYFDDFLEQRANAESIIIESVYDLFKPELGDCFGRKED